jgi:hypothetical protein
MTFGARCPGGNRMRLRRGAPRHKRVAFGERAA